MLFTAPKLITAASAIASLLIVAASRQDIPKSEDRLEIIQEPVLAKADREPIQPQRPDDTAIRNAIRMQRQYDNPKQQGPSDKATGTNTNEVVARPTGNHYALRTTIRQADACAKGRRMTTRHRRMWHCKHVK